MPIALQVDYSTPKMRSAARSVHRLVSYLGDPIYLEGALQVDQL